ncbi:MAG: HNH endonuclease signature motif containing protein [Nocardioidaceae bacterium]
MFEHSVTAFSAASRLLQHAREQRAVAQRAEAEVLVTALDWAHLHPGDPSEQAAAAGRAGVGGLERELPLAGAGTPTVAEFAVAEFAAALAMTTEAGGCLIGDALELAHRLPRLWERVRSGSLPTWRARRVAQATRWLSPEAAAYVDAHAAPFAHRLSPGRVDRLVEAAAARFQPEEAAARADRAGERRHVTVFDEHSLQGTCHIEIEADALDAKAFDHTIGQVADQLAVLGDPDSLDVRRAKAVGVLADPQHALTLLAGDDHGPLTRRATTELVLHLHLSDTAVAGPVAGPVAGATELARLEDDSTSTGDLPLLAEQVRRWAGRPDCRVTVRPVLDLNQALTGDRYEASPRIAEHVALRDRTCVFPHCGRPARRCDRDHILPYDPDGPPAQTITDNLASLCRSHHRLKTHGGWRYAQVEPGRFLWTSPLGHRYLRDEAGTESLDADDRPDT